MEEFLLQTYRCYPIARTLLIILLMLHPESGKSQHDFRLGFDTSKVNQLFVNHSGGEWQIETRGKDPWIFTLPLTKTIGRDAVILSFEYFCPEGLDHLQVFFGPPLNEARSKMAGKMGVSEGWTGYTIDLTRDIGDWGRAGDWLRIDFGSRTGIKVFIRNLALRPMTQREKELALNYEAKKKTEALMEKNLRIYLSGKFDAEITKVEADSLHIVVMGKIISAGEVYLFEIAPWQNITETDRFEIGDPIRSGSFIRKFDRFDIRNGIRYDRVLSKWALAEKTQKGCKIISHARYPDIIRSINDLPVEIPKGRKGLGGFSASRGHTEDLDELGITSATVNIWITRFMFTSPAPGRIEHLYNGKPYYFSEREVAGLDSTFRTTARKGIVTAAILLIGKAEQCPDPEIGRLLQHPGMDPAGIYSMPNLTNPESVSCYAAAIDFLAGRYSRPDKKFGRLNHWIIHNEVDAGWVWTNMGEVSSVIYMDTYIKSMRLCYAIARNYNPLSEVFISLTHHWAWTSNSKFYPSKELLELLLKYTKAEGDFQWAVAHHPYPQSLYEPKTWLDGQVEFNFQTPLITFKNLEVLDAWIKLPEVQYKGKIKRTLWLSENGTNSKSYSEQDLKEQAAGFAYAWKKMEKLDGIDGFQWHNWIDNRNEGGLRIGLRRFPNDEQDPGGKKPVWYLYQAAGTDKEDELFDLYKKTIGIKKWQEIEHRILN